MTDKMNENKFPQEPSCLSFSKPVGEEGEFSERKKFTSSSRHFYSLAIFALGVASEYASVQRAGLSDSILLI